jgi:hypothetical protein
MATPWENRPQKQYALQGHPNMHGTFEMGGVIMGRP